MVVVLRPAYALLALTAGSLLLHACGAPPEPLPSAPPATRNSGGPSSSATVPSFPATTPYPTNPTFPTQPTFPPTTTLPPTTTPPPTPAPLCGGSPSKQQVLKAVKGKPGIPTKPLEVRYGPYCDDSWQFAILGIVGQDEDDVDPLLLLTKGKASSLTVVAAGADVCDGSETGAPTGIKARACGGS